MRQPENEKGQGAATPKPQAATVKATANSVYSKAKRNDNSEVQPLAGSPQRLRNGSQGWNHHKVAPRVYHAPDGRKWRYRGKRACVVDMLTAASNGITQMDCLPWHTRLGGTIHALRKDGLEISTEIEGEFRHARYRLATRLSVIKH